MKPTYGRVSRYGLIAFASSLDQIGPFAKDVYGAALLLDCIAGHGPRFNIAQSGTARINGSPRSTIEWPAIGIADEYFADGLDTEQ